MSAVVSDLGVLPTEDDWIDLFASEKEYKQRPGLNGEFAPGDLVRLKKEICGMQAGEEFVVEGIDWDPVEILSTRRGGEGGLNLQSFLCEMVRPAPYPHGLPERLHGVFYCYQRDFLQGRFSIDELVARWRTYTAHSEEAMAQLKSALLAADECIKVADRSA